MYAVAGDLVEAIRMVTLLSERKLEVDYAARRALIVCGVSSGVETIASMCVRAVLPPSSPPQRGGGNARVRCGGHPCSYVCRVLPVRRCTCRCAASME